MGDVENVINLDHYEKQEQIGSVQYGDVFKVKKKSNGKYFAAKILKICINDDEYQRKKFERDLRCYQTLDNPAVVKFIGYSPIDNKGEDYPVIITKYMTNGCLSKVFRSLRRKESQKGWNNTKMIINILGISIGMKYLHDTGIIHFNLKPSNVLLDENYYPKLTDFGIGRYLENWIRVLPNRISTPFYLAPEQIKDDFCTYKVDVFSFGMILYEFYANAPPIIKGKTSYQIMRNITKGMRSNLKKLEEGPVKELIQKCWSESAEERPTFDDIIHCYTENRKYFWPEDVDDEEVEQYLNKFGLSLDPDKIVEFFLKNPSTDKEEEEENNNDDDDYHKKKKDKSKDKDDLYDTHISQITSISELKALLIEKIESIDYMSEDCIDSDINEDDIIMKLNKLYSQYYQRALDDNDPECLFYIANSYHKGRDPFPQDKHYAIKYMKKAAVFGLPDAIYGLAYLILPNFNGDDYDKVENFLNTLQIAVVFGSEKASYIFGFLYSIGFHVEENFLMSLIYLKYADKNFPSAMLMYANCLRNIVNEKYSKKEIKILMKKSTSILNNLNVYSTRTNELRIIAKSLFIIINEPHLADYLSRIYYHKVIDNKDSTKKQKKEARKKLDKLEYEEYLEDEENLEDEEYLEDEDYSQILFGSLIQRH